MKKIKLSQGKYALVDDADFDWLNQYKWSYLFSGYAFRTTWPDNKGVYMHRSILNAKEGEEVDHINGNKLDNQRNNIRLCSRSQNMANRTSKGMSWRKDRNRWKVRINVEKKEIYIGLYKTRVEAVRAYNEAAIKYHGEFARLVNANS